MIYYNQEKYSCLIDDSAVQEVEAYFDIKCLYGALVGSSTNGMANAASDYDFEFVFMRSGENLNRISYKSGKTPVDWSGFSLREKERNISLCLEKVKEFPSFYTRYRCSAEEDIVPDFLVWGSDYIWDSGYLQCNLPELIDNMRPMLIMDYYFSRVAGSLEKNMCLDYIPTKRVLRTIHSLNCLLWIIKQRTYPYLDFTEMTNRFHNQAVAARIFEILQIHQNYLPSGKPSLISRDDILNEYIADNLKIIERDIRKIDFNAFKINLDKESFLGNLAHLGQFGNSDYKFEI